MNLDTRKSLVAAALRGEAVARVPTGSLAVHYCARRAGYAVADYALEAGTLADAILRYAAEFGPDAVWVSADTWVSAEAMGARVGAPELGQPIGGLGPPRVQCAADIDRIPPPDVGRQGRYPRMVEALRRVVEELGSEYWVVACFDQYPFSLAAALMGLNEIMVKAVEDPAFVRALMERCVEYGAAYGRALSAAGADMLSGGDSPAGLLGPRLYEGLAWPFEQRLIRELKEATGKPVSLHVCGNATRLLGLMAASGADVLEVDQAVAMGDACRVVGPGVALWGNLDPVRLLAQGSVHDVELGVAEVLGAVRASGHRRFVLSSGCTLAIETPPENLWALQRAAAGFGPLFLP